MRKAFAVLPIVLAVSGCAVGPDYHRPPALPHSDGAFVSSPPAGASNAEPRDDWWRLYNDPALDGLIRQALAANTDLRVAEANLTRAEAALSEARTGLFPSTTVSAAATYGRTATANAAAAAKGTTADGSWTYLPGFAVAYQADLFGRVRRTIEAANANAEAVEAVRDAMRVTVVAGVARAYVDSCAYAEELAVAERGVALAKETLDLNVLQRNAGRLSDLETARAETVLEQARATVAALQGQRDANLFALTALLGLSPKDAPTAALTCKSAPHVNDPIPVGDGAGLLRRRPDVRQAERQLAQQTASIGIAVADLYPTVSLGGAVGASSSSGGTLFSSRSTTYSVGPSIAWTFPNISVARARIAEAKAGAQAALAAFDGTMLTALKESEQALSTYAAELRRNAAPTRARDASRTAYALVQMRFQAGTISQLDLVSAEQTLISAEQTLAQSDQAVADDQVAVFKALGGGWRSP